MQKRSFNALFRDFLCLQSTGYGPKRIPVSQPPQMSVVTPTPHQRVLGVSNGPQRVQRPVTHQKPASHVSVAVKSAARPSDQNVNPATQHGNCVPQPKRVPQQIQPKTNVPKVNLEPAKPPSEPANPEKPQSKHNAKSDKLINWGKFVFGMLTYFLLTVKPAKSVPLASASK